MSLLQWISSHISGMDNVDNFQNFSFVVKIQEESAFKWNYSTKVNNSCPQSIVKRIDSIVGMDILHYATSNKYNI